MYEREWGSMGHRRNLLKGIAAAGTLSIAGCVDSLSGGSMANLTFGGSSSGSSTNAAAQGVQRAVDEASDSVSVTVQETQGNTANMQLYDEGELDLTVSGRHLRVAAENNESPFGEEPVDVLAHQGFMLFEIHIWMLAREGSGIEHMDDIDEDTVVWPLPPAFSTRPAAQLILERLNLWDTPELVHVSDGDIPGMLEEERVDVIGAYGAGGASLPGWLTQVESRVGLRAIEFSEEQKEELRSVETREYQEIDPYSFEQSLELNEIGIDALPTLTEQYTVDIGRHVEADTAREIARIVHENAEMVKDSQPAFPSYHEDLTLMKAPYLSDHPVHPGVADYLEEQGVWDSEFERGEIVDEAP